MIMKPTSKFLTQYAIVIMLVPAGAGYATNDRALNRYTLYPYAAEKQEEDLLSTIVETTFPAQIATVGSAIDYILLRSGYRHVRTAEVEHALQLTLPYVHRSIGPVDTRTAIRTLIGSSWELFEDEKTRVIWFQYAGSTPEPEQLSEDSPRRIIPQSPIPDQISTESEHLPITPELAVRDWTLNPSVTLRQNLKKWVLDVNWALEWSSNHDYEILHSAVYQGTLQEAVEAVLEHYRTAPFGLTATFFQGNSVLLIEPASAGRQ